MSRQVKKVNISGKEDKSNKVTSWSNNPNHNHYPTEKLVKDSIADVESSITEIEKPKFQWKDFFDLDNWSEELVDYNRPTYLGNGELQDGGDGMGFNFPTNKPLPKNYTITFNLHPSLNGWGYYFTINSTGIIQNGTGDYDVSIVCEDGVATVTTSPTTDTYTFNTPITFFDFWFSSGGIIRNFTYSESLVSTLTVYEENALTNLGTSANATQSTINSAINTLLNDKLDVEDAFTGSYDDLRNKPSIPSASSDLSDGSDLVKKSSTVGLLKNDGSVMSSGTGSSNWAVGNHTHTTTDITNLSIPNASSTTPSADTENGSVGTGTTWARSNHTHPKSSLYAESSHNHTKSQITDFPSIPSKTSDLQNDSGFLTSHQDISGKEDTSNKVSSWSSTTTDTNYPSEKLVKDSLDDKQDELVSGTNLKTVDGVDLLGEGDIVIDVSCGVDSTVIFEDKGVTGDYNSDYTDVQSGITTTVGTTGTTLQASGYGDKFRKANALISGDFEAKYTCVSATTAYGSMRFMDSSNNNIFTVEQFGNNDNVVDINTGSTSSYPIGETITFPFTMTIRRVGTKLTVWYNDIQVATDLTVSDSDGYWAWKLYGNDGRQQTFKDFSIIEYNSDSSSISLSENTIHLGDDIITMIDTALRHMITNWEDYE